MSEQTSAAFRVASRIQARRKILGLTGEEAGRLVGERLGAAPWSKATWSTVENPGTRGLRRLDPDELEAVAAVLDTSVGALFGEGLDPALELVRTVRGILTRVETHLMAETTTADDGSA